MYINFTVFIAKKKRIIRCHLLEIQTVTTQILQGQFMKLRKIRGSIKKKSHLKCLHLFDCKYLFRKNRYRNKEGDIA